MSERELVGRFEQKAEVQIRAMADLIKAKKAMEDSEKRLKAELKELMDRYGVKNITTPVLKITSIPESESKTVDLKEFEKNEPVEYAQLLVDYPKVVKRAGYVKFEVVNG